MPKYLGDVRCWVNSGKHMLAWSFSGFDPHVWSGRALQEVFVELAFSGLASMYPVSAWSCFAPDHHGYQRACDLISGQASTGHLGHQCSHAPGRPILHLFFSSRRPRREGFVITLSLVLAMFSVIRLRMSDRAPERSRRCGRACWRVRSPAHCDAAACWPPRSRALARGAPRFSV